MAVISAILIAFAAVCGDGVVEGDEQCDDGNADPTDGDETTAELQTLLTAAGHPVMRGHLSFIGIGCSPPLMLRKVTYSAGASLFQETPPLWGLLATAMG